jgi:hypothetical protein
VAAVVADFALLAAYPLLLIITQLQSAAVGQALLAPHVALKGVAPHLTHLPPLVVAVVVVEMVLKPQGALVDPAAAAVAVMPRN